MSKLDELIAELCPDGVEYKPIIEFSKVLRGKRLTKSNLVDDGQFYVYHGGLEPLGKYNGYNREADSVMLINVGASAGSVGYSKEKFWSSDGCYCIEKVEEIDDRYLYHFMKNNEYFFVSQVRVAGIPTLDIKVVENFKVPVPPLEVQHEIVRILDCFMELTSELQSELQSEHQTRIKQYEYYRDTLFEFDEEVPNVELQKLFPNIRNGFVGTVTDFFTSEENGVRYLRGTNIHNGEISEDDLAYITDEFHKKHKKTELKADDIVMVQSGHVGDCAVIGENFVGANCHALIVMSNGGMCDSKYISYFMHSNEGKKRLAKITTGGTVKHILASKMKKFIVPVPPIEKQKQIVRVLEELEVLFNNMGSDLQVEIEIRQKQYEYYRDKLLTFKKVV